MSAEFACTEMDGLLAERASGALPAGERATLDAHLARCERCRAELARYDEVFGLLRGPAEVLSAGEAGSDLAASALRRWKRGRRRRVLGAAGLAAAAAAALALAPGLLARRSAGPDGGAQPAAWEPDVDGALEASGLRRSESQGSYGSQQDTYLAQDEDATEVDVVLAAFDAADEQ